MRPLAFTDEQIQVITGCAEPLPRFQREVYLRRVVALLAALNSFGNGDVQRACQTAQREIIGPARVS
jgi:hypothetical protein